MYVGSRLAAALVVPLLLTACSEDPEPRFDPPVSQSPTSSSPAPTPEPWEEKSDDGAVAFAKHWIDVFSQAQADGDTDALAAISSPDCKSCTGFIGHLTEIYRDGGRLESDGWRVRRAVAARDQVVERAVVTLRILQTPQDVIDGDGTVESFPGGSATFSAQMAWSSDGWLMSELDLLT